MKNFLAITAIFLLFSLFYISCSSDTITTPETKNPAVLYDSTYHYLWGYFDIQIDSETFEANITPIRNVEGHWNALKWLEQSPCSDCFKLVKILPSGNGTLLVDIQIKHPFTNKNFTGFDVRGIAIFNGSHSFPSLGLTVPDQKLGDGELINPDGFTSLYNSSTLGSGPGGLQGYIKGKFATASAPNAMVNGFKSFVTSNPSNTRNALYSGDIVTVTYEIKMPTSPMVFGYAVDASWAPPTVNPVNDPITDFPLAANCPEPWRIEIYEQPVGDGLTDKGGTVSLNINVYDYTGSASHKAPVIECPELFNGTLTAVFDADFPGFSNFKVDVSNSKLASAGDYKAIIRVEDNENLTAPLWLDLSAYKIHTFSVMQSPFPGSGWVQTWGSLDDDESEAVAYRGGYVYTTGVFNGTTDFDPGPSEDNRTSNGGYDVFLTCYDSDGNYQWTKTFGGTDDEQSYGIAIDSNDGINITGYFNLTVDFDPDSGTTNRTAYNDMEDIFLVNFDSNGNFQWVQTWGGSNYDYGNGVAADFAGNIYVTGFFWNTVDFNPSSGTNEFTSNGKRDAFLSCFDTNGNFQWVRTWGGVQDDLGMDVSAYMIGNVYVTGWFYSTADFDTGPGNDDHTPVGEADTFLISHTSSGNFNWAKTWGGSNSDFGYCVSAYSNGDVCVAGLFWNTVDFNPDGGTDNHTAIGFIDAYVSKFDSAGTFQWARTFGGPNNEWCDDVAIDSDGDVLLTGRFQNTVDFDPGNGTDYHTAVDNDEAFASRLDSDGNFIWAGTWGGTGYDYGRGIASGDSNDFYVTGWFQWEVDFDTGPGEDKRTSNGGTDSYLIRFMKN